MIDKIIIRKIAELKASPNNSRTHSPAQIKKIAKSIKEFGFLNPIITDGKDLIIAGHGRLLAALDAGLTEVPTISAEHLTEQQRRAFMIADNRIALDAGWDEEILKQELIDLKDFDFDISAIGFDDKEMDAFFAEENENIKKGSLKNDFLIAPFSVFNAREGWWQDRKRLWLSLGIKSEMGRGDNLLKFSDAAKLGGGYKEKSKYGKCLETGIGEKSGKEEMNGTSIFDPVLCELVYTWFCPSGGKILDPFAGGSVRGVVAAHLGKKYIGGDLRKEQVDANKIQADEICADCKTKPIWHCADSREIDKTVNEKDFDFLFSCPPYADLEVYSDDPKDLSTLDYKDFKEAYFEIIKKSCALLKEDSFACFVVGDVRDKNGNYYNFVGDTVQAFLDAGLNFYNEAILVTAIGSLPIRAGKQFRASRKLGKTHQNVLVFVKGDGKKAAKNCGDVSVFIPENQENNDQLTPESHQDVID